MSLSTTTVTPLRGVDARYCTDSTNFTILPGDGTEEEHSQYGRSAGRWRTMNVMLKAEDAWGEAIEADLGRTTEGTHFAIKGIDEDTLVLTVFASGADPSSSAGSERWNEADYTGRIVSTPSKTGPHLVGLELVDVSPKFQWQTLEEKDKGGFHRTVRRVLASRNLSELQRAFWTYFYVA